MRVLVIGGIAAAIGAPAPDLVHIPSDVLARIAPEAGRLALENFRFDNIFDTTAAGRDLGFTQTISLAEGFARTVAWLQQNGRVANSDEDPLDDRIVAAWRRLVDDAERELAQYDPPVVREAGAV